MRFIFCFVLWRSRNSVDRDLFRRGSAPIASPLYPCVTQQWITSFYKSTRTALDSLHFNPAILATQTTNLHETNDPFMQSYSYFRLHLYLGRHATIFYRFRVLVFLYEAPKYYYSFYSWIRGKFTFAFHIQTACRHGPLGNSVSTYNFAFSRLNYLCIASYISIHIT